MLDFELPLLEMEVDSGQQHIEEIPNKAQNTDSCGLGTMACLAIKGPVLEVKNSGGCAMIHLHCQVDIIKNHQAFNLVCQTLLTPQRKPYTL